LSDYVKDKFAAQVLELKEKGAEIVILGCTEIPMALPMSELYGMQLINNVRLNARNII